MYFKHYSITLTTFTAVKDVSARGASGRVSFTYPSTEAYFSKNMPTFKLHWVFWPLVFFHLRHIGEIIDCFDWMPGLRFGLFEDVLGGCW